MILLMLLASVRAILGKSGDLVRKFLKLFFEWLIELLIIHRISSCHYP